MSEEVLSKQENEKKTKIQEVITDGGYDSIANRKAMSQIGKPKWSLAKLKGRQIVYQMKYNEKGELIIVDVKRSELYQVAYIEKKGKYRIKTNIGTYRYWTKTEIQDDIDTQAILGNHTEENYNLRANVESIIHQTFHRLCKRQKVQYRGMIKSHWYVLSRAMWANATRIGKSLLGMSANATACICLALMFSIKHSTTNKILS